jgi:dolichyl-phosphate-mannose--protein O-mannosyl transferase
VWTALTGVSLGYAITTKWTSLSVFGIVGISTVIDLFTRFYQ